MYYRNSECDRILRRILQNGDLEAASGFLDGHEDELSALCRRPVRVAEAEACSTQVFEAFLDGARCCGRTGWRKSAG
ncbi:hypothetical protein [Allobaculum sp. Allo2]|uniref:hypothetical protein n=1 Tax=Allobaculum sp. Allo2 TaxID=2853432 RepID=UPI001F607998|nr:hypothetical protein [Allobaculum sp. Allo2]UNT93609.1 hypothetical protein KWG61_02175 [Allobaculum sp. Allo2]